MLTGAKPLQYYFSPSTRRQIYFCKRVHLISHLTFSNKLICELTEVRILMANVIVEGPMYKYLEKPSKAESSRQPCGRFSNKTILTVGTVNKNILISIPHLAAKRFNVDDSF